MIERIPNIHPFTLVQENTRGATLEITHQVNDYKISNTNDLRDNILL